MSLSPASKLHMRISTTSFPDIKLLKKKRNNLFNKVVTITSFTSMNCRQNCNSGKREIDGKKAIRWLNLEETREASARGREEGSERRRSRKNLSSPTAGKGNGRCFPGCMEVLFISTRPVLSIFPR
jgi:hypothetical protein